MGTFTNLKAELSDLYKKKGVRRVVYFHCDHWEPWKQLQPGKPVYSAENADEVIKFADTIKHIDFARKLTLFYKVHFNFNVGTEIPEHDTREYDAANSSDRVFFYKRPPADAELARKVVGYLTTVTGSEMQVHIHHENFCLA